MMTATNNSIDLKVDIKKSVKDTEGKRSGYIRADTNPALIAKAIRFLVGQYTQYGSVTRELVANALEATEAAGVDKKVSVILPHTVVDDGKDNVFDIANGITERGSRDQSLNNLIVTDYALGLTTQDMIEKMFWLGRSDKRAHESGSMGGFGIGGKSPLFASPIYTFESRCNGLYSKAVVSLGETELKYHFTASDEKQEGENFMRVIVPIRESIINEFNKQSLIYLSMMGKGKCEIHLDDDVFDSGWVLPDAYGKRDIVSYDFSDYNRNAISSDSVRKITYRLCLNSKIYGMVNGMPYDMSNIFEMDNSRYSSNGVKDNKISFSGNILIINIDSSVAQPMPNRESLADTAVLRDYVLSKIDKENSKTRDYLNAKSQEFISRVKDGKNALLLDEDNFEAIRKVESSLGIDTSENMVVIDRDKISPVYVQYYGGFESDVFDYGARANGTSFVNREDTDSAAMIGGSKALHQINCLGSYPISPCYMIASDTSSPSPKYSRNREFPTNVYTISSSVADLKKNENDKDILVVRCAARTSLGGLSETIGKDALDKALEVILRKDSRTKVAQAWDSDDAKAIRKEMKQYSQIIMVDNDDNIDNILEEMHLYSGVDSYGSICDFFGIEPHDVSLAEIYKGYTVDVWDSTKMDSIINKIERNASKTKKKSGKPTSTRTMSVFHRGQQSDIPVRDMDKFFTENGIKRVMGGAVNSHYNSDFISRHEFAYNPECALVKISNIKSTATLKKKAEKAGIEFVGATNCDNGSKFCSDEWKSLNFHYAFNHDENTPIWETAQYYNSIVNCQPKMPKMDKETKKNFMETVISMDTISKKFSEFFNSHGISIIHLSKSDSNKITVYQLSKIIDVILEQDK